MSSKRSFSAAEAKNRFGELLDAAQRAPVTIEKHGRPVAVLMSAEEFEEIKALKFERLKVLIQEGMDDIEAGRIVDGETVFREIRERLK